MSGELLALAERCEAATGPDRPLNAEIALLCVPEYAGWITHPANQGNQYGEIAPSRAEFDEWLIRDGKPCLIAAPPYTVSLDAAMTLLPELWRLRQMNFSAPCADDRKWHLNLHGGREGGGCFVGRGATKAIALCAAALRARAAASVDERSHSQDRGDGLGPVRDASAVLPTAAGAPNPLVSKDQPHV